MSTWDDEFPRFTTTAEGHILHTDHPACLATVEDGEVRVLSWFERPLSASDEARVKEDIQSYAAGALVEV